MARALSHKPLCLLTITPFSSFTWYIILVLVSVLGFTTAGERCKFRTVTFETCGGAADTDRR